MTSFSSCSMLYMLTFFAYVLNNETASLTSFFVRSAFLFVWRIYIGGADTCTDCVYRKCVHVYRLRYSLKILQKTLLIPSFRLESFICLFHLFAYDVYSIYDIVGFVFMCSCVHVCFDLVNDLILQMVVDWWFWFIFFFLLFTVLCMLCIAKTAVANAHECAYSVANNNRWSL